MILLTDERLSGSKDHNLHVAPQQKEILSLQGFFRIFFHRYLRLSDKKNIVKKEKKVTEGREKNHIQFMYIWKIKTCTVNVKTHNALPPPHTHTHTHTHKLSVFFYSRHL